MSMTKQAAEHFVWHLMSHYLPRDGTAGATSRSRAALATLRRGLGKAPGQAPEVFRYVVPALPPGDLDDQQEADYYLVAALFALHPPKAGAALDRPDFGAAMRELSQRVTTRRRPADAPQAAEGGDDDDSGALDPGVERRMAALLAASRDDLPDHLRHAVGLLSTHEEIPVGWARLLYDLGRWDSPDRAAQRKWARSFWASASPKAPTAGAAIAATEQAGTGDDSDDSDDSGDN